MAGVPRAGRIGWILVFAALALSLPICAYLAFEIVRPPDIIPSPIPPRKEPSALERLMMKVGRQTRRSLNRMSRGTNAPPFTLTDLKAGEPISLAGFRGKPVVLLFGSFTCDVFQLCIPELIQLKEESVGRVEFLFIAVPEAGHNIGGFEFLLQPITVEGPAATVERARRVREAMKLAGFSMRGVLDPTGSVAAAYQGWPLRLVAIGADGRVELDMGRRIDEVWDFDRLRQWFNRQPVFARSKK